VVRPSIAELRQTVLILRDKLRAARELLDRVVAMLVRMTKPGSRVGA
jgi:hypothetical protein